HYRLDQQNRDAFTLVDLAQQCHQAAIYARAQTGHHLIEEQKLGTGSQSARDFEELAIRQSERRRGQVALGAEAEVVEYHDARSTRVVDARTVLKRADNHIVEHRKPAEGFDDLKGAPDPQSANLVRA